ncbi:autophagy-related protein 11-domain-containing protein [Trichophaea hybrida]|nr:autophagy-related protein 11-domain-containing protein [Trichophaea hybrida]
MAEYILSQTEGLAQKIRETDAATKVMQRSVNVAFTNLETHSVGLGNSLAKLREWGDGVMDEREKVLAKWEPAVKQLLRIPVHDEFKRYGGDEKVSRKVNVLADFFEVKEVQTAAATSGILAQRTLNLKTAIQRGGAKAALNVDDQLTGLLEEVDVLVNKIRTDNEYARNLQGPKSASAASKRAYASTTDYLPGLTAVAVDIGKLLAATTEQKNAVSIACHEQLQSIAVIQSMSAPVNPQINKLDEAYQEEDGNFQLLSLVIRLPTSYGSLLIECVRRREWSEKFQNNSQKLAEELALMKEDEEKRRRKWQRSTGFMLPFDLSDTSHTVRAELNIRGDPTGGLPKVTREDVEVYIATLKAVGNLDTAVKELTQALQDFDKPSKKVTKRLKGFKMGSIHEANMIGSSVLSPPNDDELKVLRADKEQLSERVRGYESRIRKLEDLLHRGRTASNNPYPATSPPGRPSTPGVPQSFPSNAQYPEQPLSAKPTIPHRRSSSEAHNPTEPFKTRIAALMAELAAEKERAAQLQKEASENTESEKVMNARITQTEETKRDLIANLEATVQQNNTERKALTSEIEELKEKLEAAEEELYRLEEEREKKDLAERLKTMEQKKDDEISKLRAELESQTSRADEVSRRADQAEAALKTMTEEKAGLEKELNDTRVALDTDRVKRSRSQASLIGAMKQAHGHLSSDQPPEDLNALMDQVEALVSKAVAHSKELSSALEAEKTNSALLKGEKEFLQNRFDSRTLKAKDLTQRLYTHNARSIQLLESIGYKIVHGEDSMQIVKVSRNGPNNESTVLTKSTASPIDAQPQKSSPLALEHASAAEDIDLLYWMESPDSDTESEKYSRYLKTIVAFDLDAFSETVINRVKKAEQDARQLMKQGRAYREKYYRARDEASEKIAFKSFKHGDLALFLPTRNQVTRPWAAFNVGAPHFFLREQDSHKLGSRDWLLARITKVEERVVDLSRSTASVNLPHGIERSSIGGNSSDGGASIDDENPFELSDGLRWYLLDAVEEKSGAPTTPGLSSSTVASANVDAKGSLRSRKPITGAKKKLSEITTGHSRRSSSGSGHRNSVSLTADVVKAAVESAGVFVDSVPRTPVEKIVAGVRSRAGSIRSRTPAPEAQR